MPQLTPKNPGYLKLDLYCKGMRIHESCDLEKDARTIGRIRGGLGSGLEVVLPDRLYTNIPVVEPFAAQSPYIIKKEQGRYAIYRDDEFVTRVELPPKPKFYEERTSTGKPMRQIGLLQGTYLGIYPTRVCEFWEMEPRHNCRFCSIGLNLGRDEAADKTVADVVETVKAARRECGITYVHFNTGYYSGEGVEAVEPFVEATKKATGLLIGVQCPPARDFKIYDRLKKMGVNQVSFCFELWNRERFADVCPGKEKHISQARFLEAMEYCTRLFPAVNGEIIAGLEPPADTMAGIDWITGIGALPTVCVFRPCIGTDLEQSPPPATEEMVPVFRHMYKRCIENNVLIGMAPKVKVSIVLLPEEGGYFMDESGKNTAFKAKELKNAILKKAAKAGFLAMIGLNERFRLKG